jgi:cytochrome c-type biogenesis protein CcmH
MSLRETYWFLSGTAAGLLAGAIGVYLLEGNRICGTVRISANLTQHAAPGATLFIYATDANSPGPPLAVLRLRVERWPMSFVLDDADAMIPGRNLSASKSVQLEARVSPSGEALPRPGDLVGTVANVDPHTTHSVNIAIDHQIS